jgi:hypothetical protein
VSAGEPADIFGLCNPSLEQPSMAPQDDPINLVMIALPVAVIILWILILASVRGTGIRLLLIILPIVAICVPISSCIK